MTAHAGLGRTGRHAQGVPVVVRIQEGGRGMACGNVVADVGVCCIGKDVIAQQVGAIVNLMLAKLPR